ncbi:MAG TPA: ABC transporter permease [Gemmatimonadales bacterium]|jgi:predicted permease
MNDILQDIRYATRALIRQPALSLAVIVTLALGVGLNGAVFSVVNAYLFKPLPARNPEQLVLLGFTSQEVQMPHEMSWLDFQDYAKLPVFQDATAWVNQTVNIGAAGQRPERAFIGETSANYFSFLGVGAALGRTFVPGEDREPGAHRVVVLTDAFWRSHFRADSSVIGRIVPVNGQQATVIGVLPESFRPIQGLLEMAAYMPFNQTGTDWTPNYQSRGNSFMNVAARLSNGTSLAQAKGAAQVLATRLAKDYPDSHRGTGIVVVAESHARPLLFLASYIPPAAAVFLSLTVLVLLVACANVAGLLLSRTAARERELAVRAALGASRQRIARLLLIESSLLGIVGGIVALAIASWSAEVLSSLRIATDAPVRFEITPDWRVLVVTLAASLGAGLLAGAAPAWRGSAADLNDALKSGVRAGGATRQRLRSVLVASQMAVAIVVLACAGMFIRSVRAASQFDLGFRPDGVLLASLAPGDENYDGARAHLLADQLLDQVRAIPGVTSAAIGKRIPLGYSNNSDQFDPEGGMPDGTPHIVAFTNDVSPDYFATMGIPLAAGRSFTVHDDSAAPKVAIVSEAFASQVWPHAQAVGRKLGINGGSVTVVGVAHNTVWMSPAEPARPFVYLPLGQMSAGEFTLHLRTNGNPMSLVPALRSVVGSLDADLPIFDVRSFREHLSGGRAFFFLTIGATLAAVFGAIALALGAVGLFGLVAFGVEQRTREIGVRLALGADAAAVQRLMIGGGLKLVAFGLLAGVPIALLAARGLTGLLVGVRAGDPLGLAGAIAVLAAVASLAAWLPARRVSHVDPMTALRSE